MRPHNSILLPQTSQNAGIDLHNFNAGPGPKFGLKNKLADKSDKNDGDYVKNLLK